MDKFGLSLPNSTKTEDYSLLDQIDMRRRSFRFLARVERPANVDHDNNEVQG